MRALVLAAATLCLALSVGACARKADAQAAAATPAANSSAPVQWDYASSDPARNPTVANREATVPGYNP